MLCHCESLFLSVCLSIHLSVRMSLIGVEFRHSSSLAEASPTFSAIQKWNLYFSHSKSFGLDFFVFLSCPVSIRLLVFLAYLLVVIRKPRIAEQRNQHPLHQMAMQRNNHMHSQRRLLQLAPLGGASRHSRAISCLFILLCTYSHRAVSDLYDANLPILVLCSDSVALEITSGIGITDTGWTAFPPPPDRSVISKNWFPIAPSSFVRSSTVDSSISWCPALGFRVAL